MAYSNLKPCPFCGGKALLYKRTKKTAIKMFPEKKNAISTFPVAWWVMGCVTEGCILEANPDWYYIKLGFRAESKDEAIKKWNRRAGDTYDRE